MRSSVSTLKHRERVKVNTVYRFRIYPNKTQRELFAKTFGCVRFVYNRMLAEKKEHYKKTRKNLSVTPARYKSEFPWLKEVDSLALCNAQLHLQTAYKNLRIFTKGPKQAWVVSRCAK